MPKIFIEKNQIVDSKIQLDKENSKHIKVLRHKTGDNILVSDGCCVDYLCSIELIEKDSVLLHIKEITKCIAEPKTKVTIFQSLPKSDKMELIIQKCVELGVYEIVPFISKNTIVDIKDKEEKKICRWQKISKSAAEQSGRGIIPKVSNVMSFRELLNSAKNYDLSLIAYEKEKSNTIKKIDFKKETKDIAIIIGPEGGFTEKEIQECLENKILPISLGNIILRTETAGFKTLITLLYEIEGI